METMTEAKAQQIWDALTPNEQTGIRFGLFPAVAMENAEREGYDGHDLEIALMAVAKENGGMRA